MVHSTKIFGTQPDNNIASGFIEDLNFYEIEMKLFELDLERLVMIHPYNKEVLKQVEHFQNQFLIQENHIKKIKHNVRRFCLLVNSFQFSGDWKNSKRYKRASSEIDAFREHLNVLFCEFENFKKYWLSE